MTLTQECMCRDCKFLDAEDCCVGLEILSFLSAIERDVRFERTANAEYLGQLTLLTHMRKLIGCDDSIETN